MRGLRVLFAEICGRRRVQNVVYRLRSLFGDKLKHMCQGVCGRAWNCPVAVDAFSENRYSGRHLDKLSIPNKAVCETIWRHKNTKLWGGYIKKNTICGVFKLLNNFCKPSCVLVIQELSLKRT